MLPADDPLPFSPERVLVAGVTGSGKTTLAQRLGSLWNLRHVEIDGLFHGQNWTPRPSFLDDVRTFAAEDRWITEWQYTSKGTDRILAPRAQLVVWLDYPYPLVRRRLLRRTISRRVFRTRLWNGNVEPPLWKRDAWTGENDILRWQKDTRHKWEERMPNVLAEHPHLVVIRLSHPRDVDRWLAASRPDTHR
ncbi:AAA family ATPase [Microbacterium sp. UFMG61]|uniref:AAA family ATPase n=1 Tax=Microbacterium sp. UFMG61 TaxID=2745935 RepID=UPI00188DFEDD|nr:AAA family ATPase [Microbacterium sp. UFMG61]